jgi:DNA-binding transcriptional LysR family regulator
MIIDLVQLNCFVTVAEELHFGHAAARLCMTQPPLSRQIKLLEQTLGVKLFERTSRTVHLTAAGNVFLSDARRLLNLAKQAATSAQRASRGETGRITVGFTSVMGFDLMPNLIASAQQALPDIDVVLKEMVTVAQLEALEKNTIDLGFIRPLAGRQTLKYQTVIREPLMVVLPVDHPLAERSHVDLDDMNGVPFVMYSPDQGKYFYSLIAGLFSSSGVMPKYIQHLDHVHTVVGMVRSGVGISIVPASAAQLRFDNVVFRPMLRCSAIAESRMAWRADHHNPALATFRSFASDFFAAEMRK